MTSRSDPSSTWAEHVRRVLNDTYRAHWGRLLSLLVARTRRLDLAEDALGEAFARASERWSVELPTNPSGWLYTTASRWMLGRLRAEAIHGKKARLLAVDRGWESPPNVERFDALGDERLAVILLCCHPALRPEARAPLALRLVIGTKTEQIARLFLVSRATMAARITRAKKKIVVAGIPLSSSVRQALRARLPDVCRTIYLAFTAGYAPGEGADLLRTDLAGEAVELAAVLHRFVPEAAEVRALLGLLLLQHSRRDARCRDGRLTPLAEQDRSLWHQEEIQTGISLVDTLSPGRGYSEELRLQCAIARQHARAPTAADTDWCAIEESYAQLEALTRSPAVRLNRAVAVAEARGAKAGLAQLAGLDARLPNNHRLHAVRAELARRAGDLTLARGAYEQAIAICHNAVERTYLMSRRASLGSGHEPDAGS